MLCHVLMGYHKLTGTALLDQPAVVPNRKKRGTILLDQPAVVPRAKEIG